MVDGVDSNPISKETMDILAGGTNKVETLYLADYNPPADAFDMFIDKNKFTLRSVSVINLSRNPISQSDLGKMIEKFLECPRLEEICLKEVPGINVFRTFRKRGIRFSRPNPTHIWQKSTFNDEKIFYQIPGMN